MNLLLNILSIAALAVVLCTATVFGQQSTHSTVIRIYVACAVVLFLCVVLSGGGGSIPNR